MRSLSVLIALSLLCFAAACSSSDTVDEEAPPAEMPDDFEDETTEATEEDSEEEAQEEALDLTDLIDQQAAACNEVICERPFECAEETGQEDLDLGFTQEECHEVFCGINEEVMRDIEHTESFRDCLELDAELSECMSDFSCDQYMTLVTTGVPEDDACVEEMAAQEQACAPYWEQAEELRMERMSQ